ncbi:MAG TPA: cytochrome D ubiquinol oxidase subunit II, partial [Planctomycetaceae bacterium]|nr:cytochrome D ubiquinol oxidase subunit II [Planctomycetaceae bacterium]
PGGFGTLDEGMEVLTLIQTGKRDMIPVVFLDEPGGDYWRDFARFIRRRLLGRGMIDKSDLSLFRLTDNVQEAVGEILQFFRVYHGMRYVRDDLVLRLTRPLDDATLTTLNERFSDIVVKGQIRQTGPLGEERDEPELADLPRLVFRFNRHDQGRLRQLIDCINGAEFRET